MKKALFTLALLFAALSVCAWAYASEDMINPYFEDANNLPYVTSTFSLRSTSSASKVTVELCQLNEPSLVQDTVFQATASGGDGNYEYCFYILDPSDTSDEYPTGNPHGFRSKSSVSTYNYRFVVPGTYMVLVYAKDGSGNYWDAVTSLSFAIKDDSAVTTQEKVEELLEKCLAAGCTTDYDKALWFHDWLIENAYYDLSYSYYSADGVLIRGSGVCDSYSKAYLMLLEAAGIEAERVTNIDHAWNLVKLDGEWHHIDPTWDDPVYSGYETSKLSGAEYHMYFGLPDEIMKLDRSFSAYSSDTVANGINNNYFIKSGKISTWTDPLTSQISDQLAQYGYSFDLDLPTYYKLENGKYAKGKEAVVYNLSAYVMSSTDCSYDGQSLPIKFTYSTEESKFSGEIMLSDEKTLVLPSALSIIYDEAFAGSGNFMNVCLPDNVSQIGASAFANNPTLWKINIPDSVTYIDSTAFTGSDNVTIICSADSVAEKFAIDNDILYNIQ